MCTYIDRYLFIYLCVEKTSYAKIHVNDSVNLFVVPPSFSSNRNLVSLDPSSELRRQIIDTNTHSIRETWNHGSGLLPLLSGVEYSDPHPFN